MKWLADECLDNDIVRGLLRHSPTLDLIRAQDVSGIAWATEHQRVYLPLR